MMNFSARRKKKPASRNSIGMRNRCFSDRDPQDDNVLGPSVHIPGFGASQPEFALGSMNRGRGARGAAVWVMGDINYAQTANMSQTLDVLIPSRSESAGPLPVIVSIHGGAFVRGDKTDQMKILLPLVKTGRFAGISINYRFSSEAVWPAQIYDCKAAIRWVRANAKQFGIDPDRIGVIGEGAGGNLAAMLGVTSTISAMDGDVGDHRDISCAVQCVVSQFGPSDLLTMPSDALGGDHSSETSPAGRLLGGSLQSQIDRAILASPITWVSKSAAPFLLIHDTNDPVIPYIQSERMYNALRDAGAQACLLAGGIGHGKYSDPDAVQRIRQFFERHLLGERCTSDLAGGGEYSH
jgi:acetyl esterase/lipase